MVATRAAGAADAEALTALAHRSKAHWGYDDGFMALCRDELTLTPDRIARNEVRIAEADGAILGFAALLPGYGDGEIEAMFVAPEAMGQGIARRLWSEIAAAGIDRGVPRIVLDSDPDATGFYEAMGCGRIGESPSGSIPGRMLPRYGAYLPGRIAGAATGLRLETGGHWQFAEDEAHAIAERWRAETAANPALFDGRVLIALDWSFESGNLSARLAETSYAAFLYWRHAGFPDRSAVNMFGSAVVLSADGALIVGRMAGHTSNAGLEYPFGGSLEPADVGPDGGADIAASARRELAEETGLDATDADCGDPLVIVDGPRLSVAFPFRFAANADALAAAIRVNAARQHVPELADVVVLRSKSDIDAAVMPGYTQALANHYLS